MFCRDGINECLGEGWFGILILWQRSLDMRREEHKSYEQAPCYPPRQARWRTSSLTFCLRCLSQQHSKPPQDIAFVRTIRISFPEGNFSSRPWWERGPWWVGRGYRELP